MTTSSMSSEVASVGFDFRYTERGYDTPGHADARLARLIISMRRPLVH